VTDCSDQVGGRVETQATPRGMRAPFRHRDFRFLVAGQAISQTGDWLYNVALLVLVLRMTHSPTWVAAAGIVRLLPYVVFGTLGGLIADRYPRKRVMVVADLARAGLMGLLVVVALTSGSAALAILLAGASTMFSVAYHPAEDAALPLLVEEDELSAANSITSTIQNLCVALGPAVGGVLLMLGSPAMAFAVNAVTFLGSAVAISQIKTELGPSAGASDAPDRKSPTTWMRIREGIEPVRSSAGVLVLVVAWGANGFLDGAQIVLFALLATGRLGIGEGGMSFLYAALGVGGVLAAGLAHRAASRPRQGLALAMATFATAFAFAGLAFTRTPALAYVLAAIDGAATIVLDVLVVTSIQRMLGNEVMGRALGAVDSLVVGLVLAGSVVTPPIVAVAGVRAAVLVSSTLVASVGMLLLVRARAIDQRAAARVERLAPRVKLLDSLDIFIGASRATLEALAEELTRVSAPAGTVVIREGDEPDDLFVVGSGQLLVTTVGRGRVGELKAGEYFGEIGLLHRIPRTATVTASTDCELYRMRGESFLRLVNEGGSQSSSLLSNLQSRLASTRAARRAEPAAP
jgi:CRP-like cAMP-binding protein